MEGGEREVGSKVGRRRREEGSKLEGGGREVGSKVGRRRREEGSKGGRRGGDEKRV